MDDSLKTSTGDTFQQSTAFRFLLLLFYLLKFHFRPPPRYLSPGKGLRNVSFRTPKFKAFFAHGNKPHLEKETIGLIMSRRVIFHSKHR